MSERRDRRRLLLLAVLVASTALTTVLAVQPASAQDPDDLVIERFDASLDIREDGTVRVIETLSVDFGAVEHRGIVREIPVRAELEEGDAQVALPEDRDVADYWRVIDVDEIEVDASAPDDLEVVREDGAVRLRIGDPDRTVTGQHRYAIAYTVRGALNAFDDRAELTWDVTGFGWESRIASATAVVDASGFVDVACYRGPEGSTTPCEQAEVVEGEARFATAQLAPGENLSVSVGIAPDAVAVPAPLLQERWRLSRALTGDPAAVPLTAATTLFGMGAVALVARRQATRRDESHAAAAGGTAAAGSDPSERVERLRPARVRLLLRERADHIGLTATVFDLGARGHLEIRPADEDDAEAGEHRLLRREADGDPLAGFEQHLLERLFADGDEVGPDDLRAQLAEELPAFQERLELEGVERGWFDGRPTKLRIRRGAQQAGLVVGAVVVLAVALVLTSAALAAVPLVVAAVVGSIVLQRRSAHTAEGRRLADEARRFHAYLDAGDVGEAPGGALPPGERFGAYLPFAIALDAVPGLLGSYQRSEMPVERWAPTYYLFPAAVLHNDPDAFTSSVSGFGGGATGAASAGSSSASSGAGASGGGFGGGGGGGW